MPHLLAKRRKLLSFISSNNKTQKIKNRWKNNTKYMNSFQNKSSLKI